MHYSKDPVLPETPCASSMFGSHCTAEMDSTCLDSASTDFYFLKSIILLREMLDILESSGIPKKVINAMHLMFKTIPSAAQNSHLGSWYRGLFRKYFV